MIRALVALILVAFALVADGDANAQLITRPYRIYAITFRGMTEWKRDSRTTSPRGASRCRSLSAT
jgi:hypothetical protein